MRRKPTARSAGFTILELLFVLAIGSILTAVAIPQVSSGINRYKLQGSVASAVWAIQSTRYQALMKGYPYQIVLNKDTKTYQVQSAPDGTTYANVGGAVPLATQGVVLNANTTLRFRPNGLVLNQVGALNFTLTYSGMCQRVTVSPYANITTSTIAPSCS